MIVIKIGGGKSVNIDLAASDLSSITEKAILVHGGNYVMDYYGEKLGIEKKFLHSPTGLSSRYTTKETIELMYMTYAGLMNKKIVEALQKNGVNAFGISGVDGRLLVGKKHPALLTIENGVKKVVRDDLTGNIESVDTDLLNSFLEKNITPVITPPVFTKDGEVINVDGDKIAAKIALSLKANVLVFLIEAPGILKDINDGESLITTVTKENLDQILSIAQGRMKRKILECIKLIDSGIEKIIIADGRIKNPVSKALEGGGTHVTKS